MGPETAGNFSMSAVYLHVLHVSAASSTSSAPSQLFSSLALRLDDVSVNGERSIGSNAHVEWEDGPVGSGHGVPYDEESAAIIYGNEFTALRHFTIEIAGFGT